MKLPEGILDDASEEDVLFKHQIAYYNAMGGIYNMIRATMGQLPETVAAVYGVGRRT
ncbi:MAG: hypothetical protein PUF59_00965 [Lachnospiraceae bacterium]|nr:hypothetical protein [Lachnospiraceae bacterium]